MKGADEEIEATAARESATTKQVSTLVDLMRQQMEWSMKSESSRREQDLGSVEALETRMRGIEVCTVRQSTIPSAVIPLQGILLITYLVRSFPYRHRSKLRSAAQAAVSQLLLSSSVPRSLQRYRRQAGSTTSKTCRTACSCQLETTFLTIVVFTGWWFRWLCLRLLYLGGWKSSWRRVSAVSRLLCAR